MLLNQILLILFLLFLAAPSHASNRHVINFRWPNLYPESFTWDPKSDHFVLGSLRHRQIISVSDAGVVSSLISDEALPPNSSFLGISLDPRLNRLLAVVHRRSPPFSALVAYDLPSFRQIFLAPLDDLLPSPAVANDVAADYSGNAYVTDSANNVIYKVTEQGEATILSGSQVFKPSPEDVDPTVPYGLNGVIYNTKGYLLVTQSNTGKLFKVTVHDGAARRVILHKDKELTAANGTRTRVILHKDKELTAANGIAVRRDGVVLVVSKHRLFFLKSDDSWSEGVVYDETPLDADRHASAVSVGAEDRAYVLYGHVDEGVIENSERDEFSIVQLKSGVESKEENVWIFVLIGLGLAYLMYWRYQMKRLVQNMDKKTS